MARRLVLASGSPRRHDLLREGGFIFEVVRPGGTESESGDLTVRELTALNALRKAREVAQKQRDVVILGADTLVSLEGEVIGKPADGAAARELLRRLSGRTHEVCTGVALIDAGRQRQRTFQVRTLVTFKSLDDAAIEDYLRRVNTLDKAGGYAAQGEGRLIIERVEGSFSNVVGLPMEATTAALRGFGIVPRAGRTRLKAQDQ